MHDLGFIIKPVIQVGKAATPAQGGHLAPLAAGDDVYGALPLAAPLTLEELAALLTGRAPFEVEPGDDRTLVADWAKVLGRLQQAVKWRQLPDTPTLREGVVWATDVGCPMVNADRLSIAAGLTKPTVDGDVRVKARPRWDFDPDLQNEAELIAAELREAGGAVPKKIVADALKRRLNLEINVFAIARRIRKTW
jgi:hypothetical protein